MNYHNSAMVYFDGGDACSLARDLKLRLRVRAETGPVQAFFGINWVFLRSNVGFLEVDLYAILETVPATLLKIVFDCVAPAGMVSNSTYLFIAIETSSDNAYEGDLLEFSAWCGTEKHGLFEEMVTFHKVLCCKTTTRPEHTVNGLASEAANSDISLRGLEILFLEWLKMVTASKGHPVLVTPPWLDYAVLERLCPDIVGALGKLQAIDTYGERAKLSEQLDPKNLCNPWKVYNHHRSEFSIYGTIQQFSAAHLLLRKNCQ